MYAPPLRTTEASSPIQRSTRGCAAEGPSTLRNIGNWRVKETDRLAAMAAELRKLGARVEDGPDYLKVTPPAALKAATSEAARTST